MHTLRTRCGTAASRDALLQARREYASHAGLLFALHVRYYEISMKIPPVWGKNLLQESIQENRNDYYKQNTGEHRFRVGSSQHATQDFLGAVPSVLSWTMGKMVCSIIVLPPFLDTCQRGGRCQEDLGGIFD